MRITSRDRKGAGLLAGSTENYLPKQQPPARCVNRGLVGFSSCLVGSAICGPLLGQLS